VVLAYSVTSCNRDFQPTFNPSTSPAGPITLNKTTFLDVKMHDDASINIFISGATANSYVYQAIYQGNPSNYKTYAWGLNDACQWYPAAGNGNLPLRWEQWSASAEGRGFAAHKKIGPNLNELLSSSAVNTYMETAPFATDIFEKGLGELYPQQIGVDRIMVRSYPGEDLSPYGAQ
jgi:hypothetical protein